MTNILSETESVCPTCLVRIPAQRVMRGDDVYLCKTCPQHGPTETIIWRGKQPAFCSWVRSTTPAVPQQALTPVERGCPYDCGLCSDHRQQSCSVLIEVTQRCNLRCAVCFVDANKQPPRDPGLVQIEGWYRRLLASGSKPHIQLSGGEPCVRDDLPEIVALGRKLGFGFIQVNTNGLRLAREKAFVRQLKQAGATTIFLQFDGTHDDIYRTLRRRALLIDKLAAIDNCAEQGLDVVLAPTLIPGINTQQIGAIIRFALERMPAVRGVHFQPISYFGRYPAPPTDESRITLPEVMRAVQEQTDGLIKTESFVPPGAEHALCSFHGRFVLTPDGQLTPLTTHNHAADAGGCCTPIRADENIQRSPTPTFYVSGMAFQDAWNLDLERLRDCDIHTLSPDNRVIPFCAYNLTTEDGRALYRQQAFCTPFARRVEQIR